MKLFLRLFFLSLISLNLNAQTATENVEGTVSFLSSQNVYVKYSSTKGIAIGDTLYTNNNNVLVPSLIVTNLSSTSVLGSPINNSQFKVNDKITAKRRMEINKPEKSNAVKKDTIVIATDSAKVSETKKIEKSNTGKQLISGRISVSNFSGLSNTSEDNSYVMNYALSFNISHIANSKFSFESSILYRQENGEWKNVKKNIFNALKIYNLAVKYDISKSLYLCLGRKINPAISNIGAIDGLQAEKSFNNFRVGAFVGSRPDYVDYSIDLNFFQYGAYVGYNYQTAKRNMQNSLAYVEQTNKFKTDRRFIYFQHNSSLVKNVNIFYTLELDLYKVLNEQKQNTLSLTNTFLSLRYQPFKKLTLTGSYDARKNVIYYETYKDYLSTLIAAETRQGFGVQINYKISKSLYAGIKGGYRFQKRDIRDTRNAYAFFTWSNIFKSQISATVSSTFLETSYLNGMIYNIRVSRGFNSEKINIGLGYSYSDYKVANDAFPLKQHIAELTFSAELIKKISFALSAEAFLEKPNTFYRIYLQVRKRF